MLFKGNKTGVSAFQSSEQHKQNGKQETYLHFLREMFIYSKFKKYD